MRHYRIPRPRFLPSVAALLQWFELVSPKIRFDAAPLFLADPATVGGSVRRAWHLQVLAACLLAAGCSSLDNIPLSDVPIPQPAPSRLASVSDADARNASCTACSETANRAAESRETPFVAEAVAQAEPSNAPPSPAPPLFETAAADDVTRASPETAPAPTETAVASLPDHVLALEPAPAAPAAELPEPIEAVADFPEAAPEASYKAGLIERRGSSETSACSRDVFSLEACAAADALAEPALEPPPAAQTADVDFQPASFNGATVARVEISGLDVRTMLWVLIGLAALIGLFVSARQALH